MTGSISGPVTADAMRTALNGLRNASPNGAIPAFSAVPLAPAAFQRFFNHYDIDYLVKDGTLLRQTGFFDLTPAWLALTK
jgi:hypothetical protein